MWRREVRTGDNRDPSTAGTSLVGVAGKQKTKPSASPDTLMLTLSRRGPHKVLRGDLGIVGVPGQVFTPAEGSNQPAIAFGHAWLRDSSRYRDLLFHFASWGIVAVAPDTQSSVLASDAGLAADLRSALDIVAHVPLEFGKIRVNPDKLGVVGHGFGASAAVMAASSATINGQPPADLRGVVSLFPAPTTPDLIPAARSAQAPALIVGGKDLAAMDANPLELAQAYGGDVVLRTLDGSKAVQLLEKPGIKHLLGINGADKKVHAAARAATTGFLLHTLTGDPEYQDFVDPEATLGKLHTVDLDDPPADPVDPISKLFGAKPSKRSARVR